MSSPLFYRTGANPEFAEKAGKKTKISAG